MFRYFVLISLMFTLLLFLLGALFSPNVIASLIDLYFYIGITGVVVCLLSIVILGGFFDVQLSAVSPSFRDEFEAKLRKAQKKLDEEKEKKEKGIKNEPKEAKEIPKSQYFVWITGLIGIEFVALSYLYIYRYLPS